MRRQPDARRRGAWHRSRHLAQQAQALRLVTARARGVRTEIMRRIALLPVGDFDRRLAQRLCSPLAAEFAAECRLLPQSLDPQPMFHPERAQYHSTELLAGLQPFAVTDHWRVVGLASVDLYIPILTFVFGEAQMGGPCAV